MKRAPPRRRRAALSHVDARGRARMVDVGAKPATARRALARAVVKLGAAFDAVRDDAVAKGDVLAVARLAGIAGAKETSRLIPQYVIRQLSEITQGEAERAPPGAEIDSDVFR